MFDNSIFTVYTEADLSLMSEKYTKRWRSRLAKEEKKRAKKAARGESKQVEDQPQGEAGQAEKKDKGALCMDETMALVSWIYFEHMSLVQG
jgi:hypothetical protein